MENEIKRKRGRPAKGEGKTKKFQLKMTETQFDRLSHTAELSGKTKTDVLLKALEICESMAKAGISLDLDAEK